MRLKCLYLLQLPDLTTLSFQITLHFFILIFFKNKFVPIKFNIDLVPRPILGSTGNFQPTGIFYDSSQNLLFIANYQLKNILLFSFNEDTHTASFLYEIKDEDLTGPEGLTYDRETKTLFIADHDSNKVLAFKINILQKSYKKMWETSINIPHGIDYKYSRLFVTSMRDRTINELDPITGKPIMVFGKIGMNKKSLEFLWPAFVFINSLDTILVSDGHTGYIKEIDLKTLEVIQVNGGNGPSHGYFHNPGSIWRDKRGLGVTSIYSSKIVYLNEDDLSIKESIYLSENNFSFDKTGILKQLYPIPHISNWSLSPSGYGYENIHKKFSFGDLTFH
jgi:hypothetical protein